MKTLDQLDTKELEVLTNAAMADFCNGYFWMFEKKFNVRFDSAKHASAAQLKDEFSGVIAVNRIAYGGAGSGSFMVIFNRPALFSLGGLTIMQPLPRIKEECAKGTAEEAAAMADAVGEIGNLLVGSFSKILREGCNDVEGLGDEITLRLRLPVPVGEVGLDLDPEVSEFATFTFALDGAGLDPFSLTIVFPCSN
ncbi:MAG: hypothetical protein JXR25_13360 [Pontiellaceae bacterium]|nr:hypothetical protein [Pontiellaceae bacterium]MBN2785803.1 hypothetical protein [Pontiellaceae bacterium]